MNCAWQGTLEDALAKVRTKDWSELLRPRTREGQVREPSSEEADRSSLSLPLVFDSLASSGDVSRNLHVALEYRLPFNGQRIDLLLLGRRGSSAAAHVIELKHWTASAGFDDSDTLVEIQGSVTPHPSYQAASYVGKIRYLHAAGMNYQVTGTAAITAGSRAKHAALLENRFRWVVTEVPLVFSEDLDSLNRRVAASVPEGPSPGKAVEFLDAGYTQSLQLLDAIKSHARDIERGALATLAVSGWGLSADQNRIFGEIVATIKAGDEGTFIVSGGPGSGKSLLALHLLLLSAGMDKRVVLGIRNNRMNEALREVLNKQVPGAKGMLKYFSVRNGSGLEDPGGPEVDVLICDEAQRLSLRTPRVFRRAPVTVVIHDEGQILNADDRGTLPLLMERAKEAGKAPRIFALPTPHRCRGGELYVRWVDQFLVNPAAIHAIPEAARREYLIESAETVDALRACLTRQIRQRKRAALLASFTRSSGKADPVDARDLGRIRVPRGEANPPLVWLMDPRKEYVPFWIDGGSSELLHCASIYGCQGFETDFAGLVWGTDLVIRNGRWQVGEPRDCYDTIGPGKGLRGMMEKEDPRATELLRSRYRVFLTRGIFGTFIHFEDPETRAYLAPALEITAYFGPTRSVIPDEGDR